MIEKKDSKKIETDPVKEEITKIKKIKKKIKKNISTRIAFVNETLNNQKI